jgi:hypothetical protein
MHAECKKEALRTGSLGQIRKIHVSDLTQQEHQDQQQKLAKKNLEVATKTQRHVQDTHWMSSTDELAGSASDTIPSNNKISASSNDNSNTIMVEIQK